MITGSGLSADSEFVELVEVIKWFRDFCPLTMTAGLRYFPSGAIALECIAVRPIIRGPCRARHGPPIWVDFASDRLSR